MASIDDVYARCGDILYICSNIFSALVTIDGKLDTALGFQEAVADSYRNLSSKVDDLQFSIDNIDEVSLPAVNRNVLNDRYKTCKIVSAFFIHFFELLSFISFKLFPRVSASSSVIKVVFSFSYSTIIYSASISVCSDFVQNTYSYDDSSSSFTMYFSYLNINDTLKSFVKYLGSTLGFSCHTSYLLTYLSSFFLGEKQAEALNRLLGSQPPEEE